MKCHQVKNAMEKTKMEERKCDGKGQWKFRVVVKRPKKMTVVG